MSELGIFKPSAAAGGAGAAQPKQPAIQTAVEEPSHA